MSMRYVPTRREREVLRALCHSAGTAQAVADELGMMPGTARTHIANMMRRIGVHTKVELVSWWYQVGRYR